MKLFSFLLLVVGAAGSCINLLTGFFLTRTENSASDQHLVVALLTVSFLIIGSLGLIRSTSRLLIEAQIVGENSFYLERAEQFRNRALYSSIGLILLCLLSLISGTISQTGRFPLVHGLSGVTLFGLSIYSLVAWASLFGIKKKQPLA